MIGPIWQFLDSVYLVLWDRFRANQRVTWEKPARVAVLMALPLLLSFELVMLLTERWNGIGLLGSLVSNRILYTILFFVPVWILVILLFRRANRVESADLRLEKLKNSTTSVGRGLRTILYFALPIGALVFLI